MSDYQQFLSRGWIRFQQDPAILTWAQQALPMGQAAARNPEHQHWMDCEGTWFIGVDALENFPDGSLPDGTPLKGNAVEFIKEHLGALPALHRAQLSITYPGYPKPRAGEGEAAFGYRLRRDAAHVDGVKMFGDSRNRRVEEPHAWVLGIPLNLSSPQAAPLVIWEGSHEVMRRGFSAAYKGIEPEEWHLVDVTEAYKAARAEVFETCKRVTVFAKPGESYLMHRLCLHGVALWAPEAPEQAEGRAIAYFRPDLVGGVPAWLSLP
ncbi:hypothetical protein RSK20926_21624 [Roseobacter sp. SK209-2-6]|uniref:hypothetical protein n=1 Tax=Roseobacter sp. SK209-2-6 TaxID=388739 RepID=UPI0000F3F305|nr:hypothetical protein [Roseobacter sp. SK209-2-6]EBA16368.1 hypothetical protein RSK20926_21624 [Roseobacter sp. SK209-2-6]